MLNPLTFLDSSNVAPILTEGLHQCLQPEGAPLPPDLPLLVGSLALENPLGFRGIQRFGDVGYYTAQLQRG